MTIGNSVDKVAEALLALIAKYGDSATVVSVIAQRGNK